MVLGSMSPLLQFQRTDKLRQFSAQFIKKLEKLFNIFAHISLFSTISAI